MSYHETLWLAVSASAPVIALASVVSVGDAVKSDEISDKPAGSVFWLIFVGTANMAMQLVTLFIALLSIYNGRDETHSFGFAILSQPLGIALLMIITFFNASRRLKAKKPRPNTENSENTNDSKLIT